MKRLEIVHLRSSGKPLESLSGRIRESIRGEHAGIEAVALYRRRGLATDITVHLHHREALGGSGPSSLGLRLASALRGFGLVEHTLWEEVE